MENNLSNKNQSPCTTSKSEKKPRKENARQKERRRLRGLKLKEYRKARQLAKRLAREQQESCQSEGRHLEVVEHKTRPPALLNIPVSISEPILVKNEVSCYGNSLPATTVSGVTSKSEKKPRKENARQKERRRLRGLKLKEYRKARQFAKRLAREQQDSCQSEGRHLEVVEHKTTPPALLNIPVSNSEPILEKMDTFYLDPDSSSLATLSTLQLTPEKRLAPLLKTPVADKILSDSESDADILELFPRSPILRSPSPVAALLGGHFNTPLKTVRPRAFRF